MAGRAARRRHQWSQGVVLLFLLGDERLDKIEVTQVPDKTFRQCCKATTCKLYQPRLVEAGRNLHRQVLAHKAQWDKETELRGLRQENTRP